MTLGKHSQLVLRLGLAFVFGVFGVDKLFHWPLNVLWSGWIPAWLSVPQAPFLAALGSLEIIVAIFLLLNKFTRLAAFVCVLFLAGVVASFGLNDVTVRDIGLIAMALALALQPEKKRKEHEEKKSKK